MTSSSNILTDSKMENVAKGVAFLDFDGFQTPLNGQTFVRSSFLGTLIKSGRHNWNKKTRESIVFHPNLAKVIKAELEKEENADFRMLPFSDLFLNTLIALQVQVFHLTSNRKEILEGYHIAAGLDPKLMTTIDDVDLEKTARTARKAVWVTSELNSTKDKGQADFYIVGEDDAKAAEQIINAILKVYPNANIIRFVVESGKAEFKKFREELVEQVRAINKKLIAEKSKPAGGETLDATTSPVAALSTLSLSANA